MRTLARAWVLISVFVFPCFSLFAQEDHASQTPANFLFRDQFYLSPSLRNHFNTAAADGFLVLERPAPEMNSNVAIVSGFAPQALRSRVLKDAQTLEQAKEWIHKQKKTTTFENVSVHELTFTLPDGRVEEAYWVGHRSFSTFEAATAEIAMVKSIIETQGGSFDRALQLAEEFQEAEEIPPGEPEKSRAQFQKEEETALRWIDQLNLGEDLFGPFQGLTSGEKILYQSFGETTYRTTNLSERRFDSQVGFWTNRLVFRGIRFPINTLNPYVELIGALESTSNDGGSQLDTVAGLEWRPLERNVGLENFRPSGISLLKWVKNYRFYIQWMDRRNLKDEITNIRDFDFRLGVDIFYEWGIEVPPVDHVPGKGISGFLVDYVWGEYFGNYGWRDTNFTAEEDFSAFLLDTSLILGLKTPALRFPRNSLIEEIVLMPYLRLGLTANTRLSNPSDNRYFLAVGLRWMPFRSYRFQNNEWLAKTKLFAEWLSIGKVQNLKQDDSRPHPDEDWRIGMAFSLRRF